MGDMEPMMPKDEDMMMMMQDDGKPKPGEYVEQGKFCYCCTTKCGIITIAILLIIDFCIEVYNLIVILDNEYFDSMYGGVYAGILVVYFAAVVLLFIYLVAPDSPETRALIPWGFLVGAVANFLLVLWVIIYIGFLYENDKVYVGGMEGGSSDSSSTASGE